MSKASKSIIKFEEMLKTNNVLYFDTSDFINISHHYIEQANFNLAEKSIKMGLNQHPNNTDLMLLKTELLIFNSKYDDAYKILDFIEEIEPENREVYLQKATIYSKNNLSEEAILVLKKALLVTDDKVEIWNMIGMEFLLNEDFKSATPFFKKCVDFDNDDYQSLYNLIFCYDNLGMIDESIYELSSILEKKPYSKIGWHQLGKIYSKQGRLKDAIAAYDFAIISDDQFVSSYIEKAKVLEKTHMVNEALENYKLSLELSEPNSYIYFRIAKCYLKIFNKKLFLKYIKRAVRQEPSNVKAWITLIKFYIDKKNFRQAKYLAQKAHKNNYNSINILELNAVISKKSGSIIEAINFYDKIIEFKVNISWKIWKNFINCLIEEKQWSKLLKISLLAKKEFTSKPFLDFTISGCLLKTGKFNEAIYFYQSGSKMSPLPDKLKSSFPEFVKNKSLLV